MKKEVQTKAELAKSGSSCMLGLFLLLAIISLVVYWPLSIVFGVLFIYWLIQSSSEIAELEKSGQVYLGKKIELLDLTALKSTEIPFAVVIDVETTGLLIDNTMPTIKKVTENPDWYPAIVQIAWITLTRNYEIVEKNSYYIKQSSKIPESAIQIHGITDDICESQGNELSRVRLQFDVYLPQKYKIWQHNTKKKQMAA